VPIEPKIYKALAGVSGEKVIASSSLVTIKEANFFTSYLSLLFFLLYYLRSGH
jgi:hypothetical protein